MEIIFDLDDRIMYDKQNSTNISAVSEHVVQYLICSDKEVLAIVIYSRINS